MASRQEEKEARKRARMEQEAAERRAEARRKRLQMVLGGVLAIGVIAGVVVAILAGGSGGDGGNGDGPAQASTSGITLPDQETNDIQEAVEAAGCELSNPEIEGRGHEEREFTPADYETNPPTSGSHFPEWAQDGVYAPGNTPELGQLVHTLEHGRINVQYAPGTDQQTIKELEAFIAEEPYHMLLYRNETGMDAQLAATTWGQLLTCDEVTDQTWDALRTFRDRYVDTGPEQVP